MTTYYISPTGSAKADGTSWAGAATIDKLPGIIANAKPGDTVLLRADEGSYNISSALNLRAGGTAGLPITIKGVDGSGHDMNATFVSDRAADYSATSAAGSEVFRLASGANHLVFSNMSFNNVANAFHAAADVSDITIKNMTADNVSRFFDDVGSGTATATVSGLNISNVDVKGFSKGVIHLSYDTNNVVIDHVTGDGEFINNGNFAMGIHLDSTAHNVLIENSSVSNILSTKTGGQYYNGDGFTTELGNYNITFNNDYSHNNSDGGFDLKSTSTTLINVIADGNTRNFRFWANDTVAKGIVGMNPTSHGGISSVANVWLGTGGHATISDSSFYNGNSASASLDLSYQNASLDLVNDRMDVSGAMLAKLSATSAIHGVTSKSTGAAPVWDIDAMAHAAATAAAATAAAAVAVTAVKLIGTSGADTLTGHDGNDTLDGGAGADHLVGGLGDDTYVVDNKGDVVTELAGQGTDTIATTLATYTLGDNIENLTYTGTSAFIGTGNALNNVIVGGIGNDTLDGGAGADHLVGGLGDDTYTVDNIGDVVSEKAGEGTDTVLTSLGSYQLGDNVENLTYTGAGAFVGHGNDLANVIIGGAANDTIDGGAGNDTLSGGRGQDTLNGGDGNDTIDGGQNEDVLHGGAGDDHIIGGAHCDQLFGDDGNDVIYGDFQTETHGDNTFNSIDKIDGGAGNDTIYGDAVTMVDHAGCNDEITGGDGNDVIYGDADTMTGTSTGGKDTIDGGAGDDVIYGDARVGGTGAAGGADKITGGAGNDQIWGGGGNDTFVFASGSGHDVIHDFGQTTGDRDHIQYSGQGLKYADLHITYSGGNAFVETPLHDTIELLGVTSLTAADFAF